MRLKYTQLSAGQRGEDITTQLTCQSRLTHAVRQVFPPELGMEDYNLSNTNLVVRDLEMLWTLIALFFLPKKKRKERKKKRFTMQ